MLVFNDAMIWVVLLCMWLLESTCYRATTTFFTSNLYTGKCQTKTPTHA